jgi:hypothetical protein
MCVDDVNRVLLVNGNARMLSILSHPFLNLISN